MKPIRKAVGARLRRTTLGVVVMILVISPAAGDAAGSSSSGSISGRVLGIDGDAVNGMPGISVSLTGAEGEAPRRTVSEGGGRYQFTGLDPGSYTVSIESPVTPPLR